MSGINVSTIDANKQVTNSPPQWRKKLYDGLLVVLAVVLLFSILLLTVLFAKDFGWLEWPASKQSQVAQIAQGVAQLEPISTNAANGAENSITAPGPQNSYQDPESDRRVIHAQEGLWRAANWVVLLSLTSAVATLGTLCFMYLLLKATRNTLNTANLTTKHAIEQTRAAAASLDISRDAMRAWIETPYSLVTARTSDVDWPANYTIIAMIKNSGKTPALHCRVQYGMVHQNVSGASYVANLADAFDFGHGVIAAQGAEHKQIVQRFSAQKGEKIRYIIRFLHADIYQRYYVTDFFIEFEATAMTNKSGEIGAIPETTPVCKVIKLPKLEYVGVPTPEQATVSENEATRR